MPDVVGTIALVDDIWRKSGYMRRLAVGAYYSCERYIKKAIGVRRGDKWGRLKEYDDEFSAHPTKQCDLQVWSCSPQCCFPVSLRDAARYRTLFACGDAG
jgi:hypothetical protein